MNRQSKYKTLHLIAVSYHIGRIERVHPLKQNWITGKLVQRLTLDCVKELKALAFGSYETYCLRFTINYTCCIFASLKSGCCSFKRKFP